MGYESGTGECDIFCLEPVTIVLDILKVMNLVLRVITKPRFECYTSCTQYCVVGCILSQLSSVYFLAIRFSLTSFSSSPVYAK